MSALNKTSDAALLRVLINEWAQAVRAKDIDGIVARHASDVLLFDTVAPLQVHGVEGYRAAWAHFFPSSWHAGVCDISELRITTGDKVAFSSCLVRCGGLESNGCEVAATLRLTMGFRKVRGQWTIAHEHCSEPAA